MCVQWGSTFGIRKRPNLNFKKSCFQIQYGPKTWQFGNYTQMRTLFQIPTVFLCMAKLVVCLLLAPKNVV